MSRERRPGEGITTMTTPAAVGLAKLLPTAGRFGSVSITRDEYRALQRLYEYVDERRHDGSGFSQAGADVAMMRHAEQDGLRIIAWLARYVEPGDDPLKLIVQLCSDAGFDVHPEDYEWASEDTTEPHTHSDGDA